MKKIATILTLLSLASLIGMLMFLDSLEWQFSSIIIASFLLFLVFIHSFSVAASKSGLLRTILLSLFGLQIVLSLLLLLKVFEIHQLWYWQVSLGFISCSVAVISTNVRHKASPLVYYLQYLVLAIVIFSIFGLGATAVSLQVISIGFIAICVLSIYILLFTPNKEQQH